MPSETDKAWVAGLIDGDGCLSLSTGNSSFRKPILVVDNTDMEILDELKRLYGGGLVKKRRREDHHRQAWSWRVYGASQIIALLVDVLPYMHCPSKRARAWMLVEEYRDVTPRNGHYTPEARVLRTEWEARFLDIGHGRGASIRRR